jgi:hypothetical protein
MGGEGENKRTHLNGQRNGHPLLGGVVRPLPLLSNGQTFYMSVFVRPLA